MNYDFPYELAKKLNENGFPQNHDWIEGKETTYCNKCASNKTLSDYEACRPTLSELIKECGDNFIKLFRHRRNEFQAFGDLSVGENYRTEIMDTPEEAVAHLLLELSNGRRKSTRYCSTKCSAIDRDKKSYARNKNEKGQFTT